MELFLILRILLLFKILFLLNYAKAENDDSHYWVCTSENLCTRSEPNLEDKIKFKSQNICRLSCGQFGSIWPQPTIECLLSHDRIVFGTSNIRFNLVAPNAATTQYLSDVNRLFIQNIKKECPAKCSLKSSKEIFVKIAVNSTKTTLDWDTDESYKVTVTTSETATFVEIKAFSVYGARHGLETLNQLITANVDNGLVMPTSARILDQPKFKHRGLLLDTARNFIPLKLIKRTLDGMSMSKLNVFHWHATDTHSFPIEIKSVPQLQWYGAYSPEYTYSQLEIQQIVHYAKQRGIRVLIELDAPSHSGNGWQFGVETGLGDLAVCVNQQPWRKFCIQPPCGQLNPINDNVYVILKRIFKDLSGMIMPEETIHMGGDEVFLGCWNQTEEILSYLRINGMDTSEPSFYKLWSKFHEKNLKSWDEINGNKIKPVILWSSHLTDPEIIEKYLPSERYIIQTWVESELPLNEDLINKGYKIIVSTKNAWYLDHGFWGTTLFYNWRKVYDNKVLRNPGVLGGEVCMWSEYVDENSLEGRVWPRAGAAAERLWSDPDSLSAAAEQRFVRYRERLIIRGIKPDAIMPKWCVLNEGQCI